MMKLKTPTELPISKMRTSSNTSSSSNSVIVSPTTSSSTASNPFQLNRLTTLESKIYKQHEYDEEDEEEEEHSNFLDMNDDEGDIERLLDNLPPSPPSSPPRELLPDRLYAIYDFEGPDPNHLTLKRNDPVELLNDEDNYWWLCKKLIHDFEIGFVPLEFLENYDERLARLNCWKNEQHEKTSKQDLLSIMNHDELISINGDKLIDFNKIDHNNTKRPQKVAFNIKEEQSRSEILSEIYSDYTPLVINKNPYLSKQNFLVKSLDEYNEILPPQAPGFQQHNQQQQQHIFKEDSIGSFSSDTDTSPILNQTPKYINHRESNLNNSIQLLDEYINQQSLIVVEEDNEETLRDEDESLTNSTSNSSNNSLLLQGDNRHTTTTPLTSESYLNNDESFLLKTTKQKYHPFVHELFDDLIREIELLSEVLQSQLS